jgi:hypothetical protein
MELSLGEIRPAIRPARRKPMKCRRRTYLHNLKIRPSSISLSLMLLINPASVVLNKILSR